MSFAELSTTREVAHSVEEYIDSAVTFLKDYPRLVLGEHTENEVKSAWHEFCDEKEVDYRLREYLWQIAHQIVYRS